MASFTVLHGPPDRVKPLPADRESWKIGLVVQLFGLSKAELNGAIAELIGPATKDGEGNTRYQAMVVDTEFKGNFKADNMREVPAPSQEDVDECVSLFAEVNQIISQYDSDKRSNYHMSKPGGNPQGITAKAFLLLERYALLYIPLHISSFLTYAFIPYPISEPNRCGHRVALCMFI